MTRGDFLLRLAVGGLAAPLLSHAAAEGAPAEPLLWPIFKSRFVLPSGRVVDTGNEGVSHSEGQGYGMLFAEANNDRACFEQLWRWTKRNLQVRPDRLLSWRWRPVGTSGVADDPNNASDGDLLV